MILAFDVESTGLDAFHGCRPFMITATDGDTRTNYWEVGEVNCYTREVFWEQDKLDNIQFLIDKCSKAVFHNAKFDMRMMDRVGLDVFPIWNKIEDTLLAAHCICSAGANKKQNEHGLKDLAIKYLDYWDDDEEVLKQAVLVARKEAAENGWAIAKGYHPHFPAQKGVYAQDYWLCMEECLAYGCGDTERTWLLWRIFRKYLIAHNLWEVYCNRRKLLRIAYDMEEYGMYMYVDKARQYIAKQTEEMEKIRWKLKEISGIRWKLDLNKKDHLIELLHTRLKIVPAKKTAKTGVPAMTKGALDIYLNETYSDPKVNDAIKLLKKWKQINKDVIDLDSYIRWTTSDSRIHPICWITGTRETRQSFTDPASQVIKKALRKFFGPPPGYIWVNYDLVNIELRIWAYLTKNPVLIKAFEEGKSVHMIIAKIIAKLITQESPNHEFRACYQNLIEGNINLFKSTAEGEDTQAYTECKSGTFSRIYGGSDKTTNQTYSGTKSDSPPDCCALIDAELPGVGDFTKQQINEAFNTFREENCFAIRTLGGYRLDVPPDEPQKAPNYKVQGSAGYITTLCMIEVDEDKYYKECGARMFQQVHDSINFEIKIQPNLLKYIHAIQDAIERAGCRVIPTCLSTYKITVHPDDKDNPLLEGLL